MALDWLLPLILHLLFVIYIHRFPFTSSLSDSEALLKLKDSFANATALRSWVSGSVPCEGDPKWIGIICHNGNVIGLRLENMGLSGKIDVDALVEVSRLRTVSFAHNSFSGDIPEFNRLGYLKAIYLSGNQFLRDIPSEFFVKLNGLKKVWLSDNTFTGEIPPSLSKLSHLLELHLEGNQFRGVIPSMSQPTLMSFNVSNNNLEGEIPPSLSRFNLSSFEGNSGLCGDMFGEGWNIKIKASPSPSPSSLGIISELNLRDTGDEDRDGYNDYHALNAVPGMITLALMLLSMAAVIIIKKRQKKEDFAMAGKKHNNADEEEEDNIQVISMPMRQQKETKPPPNHKAPTTHVAPGEGEIVVMNGEKGVFGMKDMMKATAEMLGNSTGGLGCCYKAVMGNGVGAVVVKRVKEMSVEMMEDGFDGEMRKIGGLKHPNVLTPLGFLYRKDEKLLIYDYMPNGSLFRLLHGNNGEKSHATSLDWPARLKIIQGIAEGLRFLHTQLSSSKLPHGNLKSSNVFIGSDGEPLISEFGLSSMIDPSTAARTQSAYKAPEAAQRGVSPKCDVYCLGIIILEILTGKVPTEILRFDKAVTETWIESSTSKKGEFGVLIDQEIARSANSMAEMKRVLQIAMACVESNPDRRLEMREATKMTEEIQLESPQDGFVITSQINVDVWGRVEQSSEHFQDMKIGFSSTL